MVSQPCQTVRARRGGGRGVARIAVRRSQAIAAKARDRGMDRAGIASEMATRTVFARNPWWAPVDPAVAATKQGDLVLKLHPAPSLVRLWSDGDAPLARRVISIFCG